MSLRDDINIPVILVLGVTTGLIVAVAIIGTKAGYNYVTQVDLARNYASAEERGILHFGENVWKEQSDKLKQPTAWADTEKATVRIPLADAREKMIQSQGKAQPAKPAAKPDAKPAVSAGAQTQPAK